MYDTYPPGRTREPGPRSPSWERGREPVPGSGQTRRRVMTGYARGPFGVDWEDRIDFPRLRSDRVTAAQQALRSSDIDSLLLWKDENVRYLTSLRAQLIAGEMTSLNAVILTRDTGPGLLCSGGEIANASIGMSWRLEAHLIP